MMDRTWKSSSKRRTKRCIGRSRTAAIASVPTKKIQSDAANHELAATRTEIASVVVKAFPLIVRPPSRHTEHRQRRQLTSLAHMRAVPYMGRKQAVCAGGLALQ